MVSLVNTQLKRNKWRFTTNSERLAEEALKYLGAKSIGHGRCAEGLCHLRGLDPAGGFDCSGFIVFLLKQINFPFSEKIRHASQFHDFFGMSVQWIGREPGDLVTFSRGGLAPTHIGIIISDSQYIHAPGRKDTFVRTDDLRVSDIPITHVHQRYSLNPIGIKKLAIPGERWQSE